MEKISKAQVKMVRSLHQKKFRDELGLFVAEGEKCVSELCKAFELELKIYSSHCAVPAADAKSVYATPTEIEQMSGLRTPQGVIGIFRKGIRVQCTMYNGTKEELILALDGVQDPGNLGTIIRTCDWFGVHDIVCSRDTADCYNPKVVQATMGALARVRVHYTDLPAWLKKEQGVVYGTLLEGEDMYQVLHDTQRTMHKAHIIVMGNEGNGISPEVRQLITHPIRIPSYPKNADTSESLNVSIATAIVLAEFRRPR